MLAVNCPLPQRLQINQRPIVGFLSLGLRLGRVLIQHVLIVVTCVLELYPLRLGVGQTFCLLLLGHVALFDG